MFKKAFKFINQTASIAARSCNRLMVGKVFWKGVALPSLLHSMEAIYLTKAEINKLQIIENKVYRIILRAPRYTPNSALRSEVGASCHYTRDMKNKLAYIKYIMNDNGNSLVKDIFLDIFEKQSTKWARVVKEYLKEIDLNIQGLLSITDLDKEIKKLDTKIWKEEIQQKSTLTNYYRWKPEIGEEERLYGNGIDSAILFRARTNTLDLQWRKRFTNDDTLCILCKREEETLDHFILRCEKLNSVRSEHIPELRPQAENSEIIIKRLLLFQVESDESILKNKKSLFKLWKEREKKIKELEPEN